MLNILKSTRVRNVKRTHTIFLNMVNILQFKQRHVMCQRLDRQTISNSSPLRLSPPSEEGALTDTQSAQSLKLCQGLHHGPETSCVSCCMYDAHTRSRLCRQRGVTATNISTSPSDLRRKTRRVHLV